MTSNGRRLLLIVGSLVVVFAVAATRVGVYVAGILVLCLVTGYLNGFYVLRPALRFILGRGAPLGTTILIALVAFVGNALLVYQGFGFLLGAVTVGFIVIDGVALQFR